MLNEHKFFNSTVLVSLNEFKKISDVIVANRISENLKDVNDKVFTRGYFTMIKKYALVTGVAGFIGFHLACDCKIIIL